MDAIAGIARNAGHKKNGALDGGVILRLVPARCVTPYPPHNQRDPFRRIRTRVVLVDFDSPAAAPNKLGSSIPVYVGKMDGLVVFGLAPAGVGPGSRRVSCRPPRLGNRVEQPCFE